MDFEKTNRCLTEIVTMMCSHELNEDEAKAIWGGVGEIIFTGGCRTPRQMAYDDMIQYLRWCQETGDAPSVVHHGGQIMPLSSGA
jgi:hypothetical protein